MQALVMQTCSWKRCLQAYLLGSRCNGQQLPLHVGGGTAGDAPPHVRLQQEVAEPARGAALSLAFRFKDLLQPCSQGMLSGCGSPRRVFERVLRIHLEIQS